MTIEEVGLAYPGAYIFPDTSDDVENGLSVVRPRPNPVMNVAAAGLIPISPTTEVAPVVEIPDFAKTVKLPAEERLTASGPAASAVIAPAKTSTEETIETAKKELLLILFNICFMNINELVIN